jgi:protein-S-isoprenylcysteine O-methyltransferase
MFPFAVYPSPIYGIAFTISFWCWFLFEIWVFSRDRGKEREGKERAGSRGTGLWFLLALALGITWGFNMPAIAPKFDIQGHFAFLFVLGIVLMCAGMVFRFWSIQTPGSFFSTRLIVQERHELITEGPYEYVPNPSYTGALIAFVGFGFGVGNWPSVAVLLLTGLINYALRIKVEERMLLDAFGASYEDYKTRTWALIPFVW